MDTTKDNKLSRDNLEVSSDEDSEKISDLFRKYSIEKYFWRNYKNNRRTKTLLYIFLVATAAVICAVLFCTLVFN